MVYLAVVVAFSELVPQPPSVGSQPAGPWAKPATTADAAGINVTKYQYLATCIGVGISGLGSLYHCMDYTKGTWDSAGGIESLLACGGPRSSPAGNQAGYLGSYLFGLLSWLYFTSPA